MSITQSILIPRWKYHAAHAATAAGVAFIALSFDASMLLAVILGTIAWPVLHELVFERFMYPNSIPNVKDKVADFIQHQPLWVVYLLHAGYYWVALSAAITIAGLYWATLGWSKP